jgi:hypothetical protein
MFNDITHAGSSGLVIPRSEATKDLLRKLSKRQSRSFAEPVLSEAEGLRMTDAKEAGSEGKCAGKSGVRAHREIG